MSKKVLNRLKAQKILKNVFFMFNKSKILHSTANDLTGQPEDHGTSHVSAIDAEGNAVSVTSSVNQWLGAMR
jgi:gamma-glutamyltranspeptidase